MSILVVNRKRTRQPQGIAGIAWSSHFSTGLSALFSGVLPGVELVRGKNFSRSGSPVSAITQAGQTIKSINSGASYDGYSAPELAQNSQSDLFYDPVSPPITLFIVGNGRSGVNLGSGIVRGNGSGDASFSLMFWDGSAKGASFSIRTSGGSIAPAAPPDAVDTTYGLHVAVLSIGPSIYQLTLDGAQKQGGSTPSGNFYYEYNDIYRCLSLNGYNNGGGNLALAGLVVGEAWDNEKAAEFCRNPWKIFEPKKHISYFDLGGVADLSASALAQALSVGTLTVGDFWSDAVIERYTALAAERNYTTVAPERNYIYAS